MSSRTLYRLSGGTLIVGSLLLSIGTVLATLRNEVDLSELSEHLLAVVQETMQPSHVSLWLRKDTERSKANTDV